MRFLGNRPFKRLAVSWYPSRPRLRFIPGIGGGQAPSAKSCLAAAFSANVLRLATNPARARFILLSAMLAFGCAGRAADKPSAGSVFVALDAPVNAFTPEALGAGIDGHHLGDEERMLSPANVRQMLSAGLKPVSYRLRPKPPSTPGTGTRMEPGATPPTVRAIGLPTPTPPNPSASATAIAFPAAATPRTKPTMTATPASTTATRPPSGKATRISTSISPAKKTSFTRNG